MLCADDLMANAVRHAGGTFEVKVQTDGLNLRVTVKDADPRPPAMRQVRREADGGRGMHIVDVLSARWGCEPAAPGKLVWFEVRAPHGSDVTEGP